MRIRGVLGTVVVVPGIALGLGALGELGACGSFAARWTWGELSVDHRLVALSLPVAWGIARLAARRFALARGLLDVWERADPWLATLLLHAILFRWPPTLFVAAFTLPLLLGFVAAARRAPLLTAVYTAAIIVTLAFVVPRVLSARLIARIAEVHDLSVDHRLEPDGKEINADGIRFQGRPGDLSQEDHVVLFLGDSFTYGSRLPYRDSYPYAFEDYVNQGECAAPVRAVNFGWISSSPLLSLRLLREIGYKYRPDLVVYNLDMTDFHDDLRYERDLRSEGDLEIDWTEVANLVASQWWPWGPVDVRAVLRLDRAPKATDGAAVPPEEERFFVTARPLEQTRADIERGVMKNLAAMHAFAVDVLDASFVLVVYPRAYQYSKRESPRNWEADRYEQLGRYAREPFRYFDQVAADLPYPVVSLLSAFEQSDRFPLFFRGDPHWNRYGAALAAETVARRLAAEGWVPCRIFTRSSSPAPSVTRSSRLILRRPSPVLNCAASGAPEAITSTRGFEKASGVASARDRTATRPHATDSVLFCTPSERSWEKVPHPSAAVNAARKAFGWSRGANAM
jgi:hypothetical protein